MVRAVSEGGDAVGVLVMDDTGPLSLRVETPTPKRTKEEIEADNLYRISEVDRDLFEQLGKRPSKDAIKKEFKLRHSKQIGDNTTMNALIDKARLVNGTSWECPPGIGDTSE